MNKKMISLVLAAAILGAPSVSFAQKLSSGKPVSVRLTSDIQSNGKIRNEVTAIVDRDVKDAATDAILIKRGTPVVIDAHIQKARGVGKPAAVKKINIPANTLIHNIVVNDDYMIKAE